MELVSIGTVADLLPLMGVNRQLVKQGLGKINNTKRIGIRKLLELSGLENKAVDSYHLGFLVAPRLNAAGRLDQGIEALRLLCTTDKLRAHSLAVKLNELNKHRQDLVSLIVKALDTDANLGKLIVVSGDYHEGVIGLIASKLVETYYRPAIVISTKGKMAKGSARSIDGFNIIELIKSGKQYLQEAGGHPMAAGFSLDKDNIGEFSEYVSGSAEKVLADSLLIKTQLIDIEMGIQNIDRELIKQLNLLEPFGSKNYKPVFMSSGLQPTGMRYVGRNSDHLKFKARHGKAEADAIIFGAKSELSGDLIDAIYEPTLSEWNGKQYLGITVKDYRLTMES